jgi:hypothetical protein
MTARGSKRGLRTCAKRSKPSLQYNLNRIFKPRHVAVVGASEKAGTIGNALMRNLVDGGFSGTVLPVNPKYQDHARAGVLRIGFRPGDGRGPGGYRHADS